MTDKRESCQEEVRKIFCAALETQSTIEMEFDSESNTGLITVSSNEKTKAYYFENGKLIES